MGSSTEKAEATGHHPGYEQPAQINFADGSLCKIERMFPIDELLIYICECRLSRPSPMWLIAWFVGRTYFDTHVVTTIINHLSFLHLNHIVLNLTQLAIH